MLTCNTLPTTTPPQGQLVKALTFLCYLIVSFLSLLALVSLRGFKMAFLNIVSLPKRFDEINFTLSNKLLDIMSFSETRLNSTIPDSMIHIDGYDIIRKDRSRNGGGVCIYIRNTINYQIRHDLSPPILEAICMEISKPHYVVHIVAHS